MSAPGDRLIAPADRSSSLTPRTAGEAPEDVLTPDGAPVVPIPGCSTARALRSRHGLEIVGVSHRFGDIVAADDVALEVNPGEVHCLLGPSGSGKSTLLRLVAGLERLQSGSISIADRLVARRNGTAVHVPPERRAVGFVFQDYALFPHLDVRRNVMFGMDRGSRSERRRAADAWLERVGMTSHAAAMPHTLSGGQQQRVALARALAREPAVMLLDEPFSGLDERLRGTVRKITLELLRAARVATLMVTHDPRESLLAGDVVSVVQEGRIVQSGPPRRVFDRSADRRVAEVFGPINRLEGMVHAGGVATPWGRFDASEVEDGRRVEIVIRPGAVELDLPTAGTQGSIHGRIVSVRSEGVLDRLVVESTGAAEHRIKCYDLARRGWTQGAAVVVTIPSTAAQIRELDRLD